MELHAHTRTISDLLSVKKKYIVPRYQREYSWSKEQVRELWDDLISCVRYDSNVGYQHEEYFIGALVFVGDEKASSLQIVDGQQRLTTLTILLSGLCERFLTIEKENLANAIYENYIAGKDDDGNEYFKLENESPRPFFQRAVQHIEKEKLAPGTTEERSLLTAYNDLKNFLSKENLSRSLGIGEFQDAEGYSEALVAIRNQVVQYLKVIFIAVGEEEEAYTIFETLNARGMNLSSIDLIKNSLFKTLKETHPDDKARTAWNGIRATIGSRDGVGTVDTFIRHWWISKYSYVSTDNVYKSFKKLLKNGELDAKAFIEELSSDAKLYVKISSPLAEDFPQKEDRQILNALQAFKTFNLTQHKPFLLSLFKGRARGIVKHSVQEDALIFLEKFQFMFNAVCSLRPSGVESSYCRAARELQKAESRPEAKAVIESLKASLRDRIPDESTFIDKFSELRFHKGFTKDKRLIQYILSTIEKRKLQTAELVPSDLSIEHILSESVGQKEVIGQIGNLLPLSKALNEIADNKTVNEKVLIYADSEFAMPKEFGEDFIAPWDEQSIGNRTLELAESSYELWTPE